MRPEDPPRSRSRRVFRAAFWVLVAGLVGSVVVVALLRWIPPPVTAFMLRDGPTVPIDYEWVPARRISPELAVAVMAAEDQKFPRHKGFDVQAIGLAWEGGRNRGASTISQQVAKNLFLWPGRSWVRKGLEAYFTVLIEALWPKRRILEVYLNIAQFGAGIYGAEAAARRFFRKPASALGRREAALLAAVLPNPVALRVERPSAYVLRRVAWIQRQAGQLGGTAMLEEI